MELEDYKTSEAARVLENANLIKKYHANLVYDYTEYPTKGIWKETFSEEDYKNAILEWFPKNPQKPVLRQIHTFPCIYEEVASVLP